MNDARTTRRIDSPRALRGQRGAAAAVAEYIHELSDRHADRRHRNPAVAGHAQTGSGADHTDKETREVLGAPTR